MSTNAAEFWLFGRPTLDDVEDVARRAEADGFDGLALTDSQNLSPDTYVALTLAARATTRLKIGPGVTNPRTRHAAVTAGAIASIQAVSNGRAVLGLGRGDSSLFNIGERPVPLAPFEQYVRDVQAYLGGDAVEVVDGSSRLQWLAAGRAPKVPLDVAATGPKVIAIGARCADRVSFSLGAEPERVAWAVQTARAAAPAGAMPSLGVYLNVCVHDDIARGAELVRAGVGIFAHFTGMPGATRERVAASDEAVFDRLGNYDKARHGRPDAAHAEALPVEFIERFAVVGPPARCIERLRALRALGIERFVIIGPRADHFGDEARTATARFAADVMPALRAH